MYGIAEGHDSSSHSSPAVLCPRVGPQMIKVYTGGMRGEHHPMVGPGGFEQ